MSGETRQSVLRRYESTLRSIRRGWTRFTTHRLGVVGLGVLVLLVFVAVFAPFLAPHPVDWEAPSSFDQGGAESLQDLMDAEISHPEGPKFGDPYFAPLGTDHRGRDVLTQLIYGTRITLYIGLVAGLLSSLVGIPVGLISGFYGDTWIDEGIQRIIDVIYSLPFLPLLIVFVSILGVSTTNVIIAIVLKSWLNNAIVIRGQTLSLKERSYVEAAKVAGSSDTRIIFRHILPNVLPLGFVYLAQDAAFAIIAQASLAFLGYADVSNVSWGTMLQWVQVTGNIFTAPWWMIPPGLLITLIAASFYFVGYSLEDVTNPHMGREDRAPAAESASGWGGVNVREVLFAGGVLLGATVFMLGFAYFVMALSMGVGPPAPYFASDTDRYLMIGIAVALLVAGVGVIRGMAKAAGW